MSNPAPLKFKAAFEGDTSLSKYGDNALLMFALDLYLRPGDLDEFASDSLTDGPGDKKIDVCYVNTSDGRAIVAQGYMSENWNRSAGPSNKAADLHIAMSWLLSTDIKKVPINIRSKAQELRQAIVRGEISRLEMIFVSNCPSSQNVRQELKSVEDTTKSLLIAMEATEVMVSSHEFGLAEINDLYITRDRTILVDDHIEIPCVGLFEEKGVMTGMLSLPPLQVHGFAICTNNMETSYLAQTSGIGLALLCVRAT